jgi:hypothetical protein
MVNRARIAREERAAEANEARVRSAVAPAVASFPTPASTGPVHSAPTLKVLLPAFRFQKFKKGLRQDGGLLSFRSFMVWAA